jgi:biopolymer transport protein ExbD
MTDRLRRSRSFPVLRTLIPFAIALTACGLTTTPVAISLTLQVDDTGKCYLLSKNTPCEALGTQIAALHAPAGCEIIITVGKMSPYESVAAALSSLQRVGFTNIAFGASASAASSAP